MKILSYNKNLNLWRDIPSHWDILSSPWHTPSILEKTWSVPRGRAPHSDTVQYFAACQHSQTRHDPARGGVYYTLTAGLTHCKGRIGITQSTNNYPNYTTCLSFPWTCTSYHTFKNFYNQHTRVQVFHQLQRVENYYTAVLHSTIKELTSTSLKHHQLCHNHHFFCVLDKKKKHN